MSEYTPKTTRRALKALPHLVRCAQLNRTITYSELSEGIGVHHRAARFFLGYIRDELCAPRGLPSLNAIVVGKQDGLPGESFLAEGTAHLDPAEYEARFRNLRDAVFACSDWDHLLAELDVEPVKSSTSELDREAREYAAYLARSRRGGEGKDHKRLKDYVTANPEILGIDLTTGSAQEYQLPSGDRADVVFELSSGGVAVVEIKTQHRADVIRGVYQAVKYRALLVAERGHGKPAEANAYLVAHRIPADVAGLSRRLSVTALELTPP